MDIKPDNILIDGKMQMKLADFGLAMKLDDKRAKNRKAGTLYYMAPEIVGGDGCTVKCDIWSPRVTCYEIFLGNLPFYDENKYRTETMFLQASYR